MAAASSAASSDQYSSFSGEAGGSLGRSSSMDARDGLIRSDSQRRTATGGSTSGKGGSNSSSSSSSRMKGTRAGNDLFVCFAPRTTLNLVSGASSRPVLSPARDKGIIKEPGSGRASGGRTGTATGRSGLSTSIFSNKLACNGGGTTSAAASSSSHVNNKKQGGRFNNHASPDEEPTSPKVTCIGQVRAKSKHSKRAKAVKGTGQADRPAASSGQHLLRKGGMLQRSLRDHEPGGAAAAADATTDYNNTTSSRKKESACPSFGKDFSCFGLPCDNSYGSVPSFRSGEKKGSSGTVLAKSLVLLQEEERGELQRKQQPQQLMPTTAVLSSFKTSAATPAHNTKKAEYSAEPSHDDGDGDDDDATHLDVDVDVDVDASVVVSTPTQTPTPDAMVHAAPCRDNLQPLEAYPNAPVLVDTSLSLLHSEAAPTDNVKADEEEEEEEEEEDDDDDTFDSEPPPPQPPPNALLLMRNYNSSVERLRVLVPPPSINLTLKRSISAPIQSRKLGDNAAGREREREQASSMQLGTEDDEAERLRGQSCINVSSADHNNDQLPLVGPPKFATTAAKAFLQRCKSVSQSLTRSSISGSQNVAPSSGLQLESAAAANAESIININNNAAARKPPDNSIAALADKRPTLLESGSGDDQRSGSGSGGGGGACHDGILEGW